MVFNIFAIFFHNTCDLIFKLKIDLLLANINNILE